MRWAYWHGINACGGGALSREAPLRVNTVSFVVVVVDAAVRFPHLRWPIHWVDMHARANAVH